MANTGTETRSNLAWIPNSITLSSIASSVLGLMSLNAFQGDKALAIAILCFSLSLLIDRIDGPVARKLGVASELGALLDSLADLVAFAVLPALILQKSLSEEGFAPVVCASAVVYVGSGCWRIAKFHFLGLQKTRLGESFIGVPTPATGAALCCVIVVNRFGWMPDAAVLILTWILAALMNSRVYYPKRGIGAWPWMFLVPLAVAAIWKRALGL